MFKDEFGKRLAILRKKIGLKQSDISAALGLGRSSAGMYEIGHAVMNVESLNILVQKFDLDQTYLMTGKPCVLASGEHLDWNLLVSILKVLEKWEQSKVLTLSDNKKAQALQMAYEICAEGQETSLVRLESIFKLAA